MHHKSERTEEERHNVMVEDVAVTSFFKRHVKHMPATIKLHAELSEDKDYVFLESKVPGHREEDIHISATPNTIEVDLVLEKIAEEEIKFHNSYFTPAPIDPKTLEIHHKDGVLKVKAKKR
ncbi:MAG: Hsp20/alpha crystallin family protein [Candidatus Altiarchaeota archaeon]|nr:Hsp20/alpha crystallin family protein [Candidatus Altiarchaeota archaeon]